MDTMELAKKAVKTATEHGFCFEGKANTVKLLNLVVGELHEGLQHIEERKEFAWAHITETCKWIIKSSADSISTTIYEEYLANTVEMEVADCYIRVLAILGYHNYNTTKEDIDSQTASITAGRLQSFDELVLHCTYIITKVMKANVGGYYHPRISLLLGVLGSLDNWCKSASIDLDWFVSVKMRINETRPYLHIKK